MTKKQPLKLVDCDDASDDTQDEALREDRDPALLRYVLRDGVVQGDADKLLQRLPRESVDLFFMSPPYADARSYSVIHPDRYVEWFLPFARHMFDATKLSGSMIINIKNRVANRGPLKGQRHPYVYGVRVADGRKT